MIKDKLINFFKIADQTKRFLIFLPIISIIKSNSLTLSLKANKRVIEHALSNVIPSSSSNIVSFRCISEILDRFALKNSVRSRNKKQMNEETSHEN